MKGGVCLFLCALAALSVLSCGKASREATYASQETKIASYIESATKTEGVTFVNNDGAYRIVYAEGSGDALQANGLLSFYYATYIFNGSKSISNLMATNHKETATTAGWDVSDASRFEALTVSLDEADFVEGLKRGLVGVKADQEADIVFSGRYGFGPKTYGQIPANSALLYEIWVVAVTN